VDPNVVDCLGTKDPFPCILNSLSISIYNGIARAMQKWPLLTFGLSDPIKATPQV